jgi:hypothetical protein
VPKFGQKEDDKPLALAESCVSCLFFILFLFVENQHSLIAFLYLITARGKQPHAHFAGQPGHLRICAARYPEHDPEKWIPVFRKDHAQIKR